jgi:hypothetical protein
MSVNETEGTGTGSNADVDLISKEMLIVTPEHTQAMRKVPLSTRIYGPIVNKKEPGKSLCGMDLVHRLAFDAALRQIDIKVGLQLLDKFESRHFRRILGLEIARRAKGSKGYGFLLELSGPLMKPPLDIIRDKSSRLYGCLESPNLGAARLMAFLELDTHLPPEVLAEFKQKLLDSGVTRLAWLIEPESVVVGSGTFDERKERVSGLFRKRREDRTEAEHILHEIGVALLAATNITQLLTIALLANQPTTRQLEGDDGHNVRNDRARLRRLVAYILSQFVEASIAAGNRMIELLAEIAMMVSTPGNVVPVFEIDFETGEIETIYEAAARLAMILRNHTNSIIRCKAAKLRQRMEEAGLFKKVVEAPRPELETGGTTPTPGTPASE